LAEVDDRIVAMKFDNAAFEQKLTDTIASLDKLRQSLDFANSRRGLDELSTAGKNFDMGDMEGKVGGVGAKFLALTTIGVTALATITAHAVTAGAQMVKSFSFGPIIDGFHEFETNMGSIQTIMSNTASKGTTLKDVNAALDQLNTYSDKTIYNFGEMARNIGTFTAAGVDLDTSVKSIKGIANIAAMSGSSSEQASTAMYQLSQAIASGTVKLMDWNSVVNAGMGGEVFQKALFESGKAMKTLKDVPMGETFDEWKKKGNTFRESLQDGWITSEVLTKTLSAFTGDLSEQQIIEMGYTKQQAEEFLKLGKNGQSAAQDIKTFTQLMSTTKESIGSGWSTTFRTVLGDFEEGKKLWTGLGNAIGGFIGQSADARNKLLQQWKDLGGRDSLLQGLENAFQALANVLVPIKEAFREIFPPMTAQRLLELTKGFENFTNRLAELTEKHMPQVKEIFKGVFAALEIGVTIIKGVLGLIGSLIGEVVGSTGGGILDFFANIAGYLVELNQKLVAGGGIAAFFDGLTEAVKKPIEFIKNLVENIREFFGTFKESKEAENVLGRVNSRLDTIQNTGNRLTQVFQKVRDALEKVWGYISTWFKELGNNLAEALGPGDFDAAVDAVNVGLLGGIVLLFKKFMKNGFKLDVGGGVVDKIKESLDGLTGTLQAMQTNLKANALLKIAGAVGILTVSIVALSLIDSAALTKALTGIAVGFGQLIGVMTLMDKAIGSTKSAAKVGILSGALIALSTAMLILSAAIKVLSGLSWGELVKGLTGVGVGLTLLVGATQLMTTDTSGLIRSGIAMGAMATAMYILAQAVQAFATLSWSELAKGLAGVAVGLGLVTVSMNFMPVGSTVAAGAAMIPLATGLLILSKAVQSFSTMSWGEMAKGMVGLAGGLLIIAGAMNLMPINLQITAAGMVVLSVALLILSKAVQSMGNIPFGEMAKGIGGLAAMLVILAAAMTVMTGTAAGAASLLVVSGALVILTYVLKELAGLSYSEIVRGLLAMAGVFVVLGAAGLLLGGLVPTLMGLGTAMALIGGAFALFGIGVMLVAKAVEVLAESGEAGAKAIVKLLGIILSARIVIVNALVDAFIMFAKDILNAAPLIIKMVRVLLSQILDTIIELTPKIALALVTIITNGLMLIREKFPDLLETGYEILLTILKGIRDHILEIVTLGAEIMVNFVAGLVQNMPMIVQAGVNLVISFLGALAGHVEEIVAAGLNILVNFISGIANNINKVTEAVANLITAFLLAVSSGMLQIIEAGTNILLWLLQGIFDNIMKVVEGVTNIVLRFVEELANNQAKIIAAGFKILTDFLSGILNNLVKVTNVVGELVTKFITAIGDQATKFIDAGANAVVKFLEGVGRDVQKILDAGTNLAIKLLEGAASDAVRFTDKAGDILVKFLNGMAAAIRNHDDDLRKAGMNIAGAIADGMTFGLASKAGDVAGKAVDVAKGAVGKVTGFLGINSPSKKFIEIGESMGEGMAYALKHDNLAKNEAVNQAERIVSAFEETLRKQKDPVLDLVPTSPVITPVLDLTKVNAGAKSIDKMMRDAKISANLSLDNARLISVMSEQSRTEAATPPQPTGPTEVKFEQNNYSPKALSVNDIYRNTKSQIALAKEELGI